MINKNEKSAGTYKEMTSKIKMRLLESSAVDAKIGQYSRSE